MGKYPFGVKIKLLKCKKFLSLFLCMAIFFGCFATLSVKAITYPVKAEIKNAYNKGVAQIYSLPGTTNHETEENKGKSEKLCELADGSQIMVLGEALDGDGDKWYKINYGDKLENEGYAYSVHVILKPEYEHDEDFEQNLKNFPESYHAALRVLHAKYPNWKFVANKFDLTFKQAVEAQYGVDNVKNTLKWVEFTYGGNEWRDMRAFDTDTQKWIVLEERWTYASRAAIEYFMDPRNSLNENMIFAFMQQSYQVDENLHENLRTIIKGTFLEVGYDKDGDGNIDVDAYVEDLIKAATESGVSPYVLAATIIIEQGEGNSGLVSGEYPGFEGYYNFFNFAASGSSINEIIASGLTYAKNNGWNSREASIIGGAKKYADGYISVGQDTYYYKDFNVVNKIWNHQYASALYDAWTNAMYLQKGCVTNNEAAITFSIPVFADMPETVCPAPSEVVIPEPTPDPEPEPEPEPTPPPEPVIKKGDTNDDGVINAVDLATVKMDILGVKKAEGNAYTAADVNSDGAINAVDLAAIKMHILGVKTID